MDSNHHQTEAMPLALPEGAEPAPATHLTRFKGPTSAAPPPPVAESFSETLPQAIRDSLTLALLADPDRVSRIPADIRERLGLQDGDFIDLAGINDLKEVDVFRMSRAVTLPVEVQELLENSLKDQEELPYEKTVNLWGQTGDKAWHLLAMQISPAEGKVLAVKLHEFGFVRTHAQKPYSAPPHARSHKVADREGGPTLA
jgi:bifunctional DNA-binding transcriptional regulator/antitoxin component of YhaV-PrlF toxin-antitoxin module